MKLGVWRSVFLGDFPVFRVFWGDFLDLPIYTNPIKNLPKLLFWGLRPCPSLIFLFYQGKSEPIFGKGMRRSTFQWKKGFFSETGGEAIQWMGGLVRISTGKAIQWRAPGDSVNRRTLESEKLLSSSPSRKSALNQGFLSPADPTETLEKAEKKHK